MKQKSFIWVILLMCMLATTGAYAFVPTGWKAVLTPGKSHDTITKEAMEQVYADLGITKVTKSMKKAREVIMDANARVDEDYKIDTAYHCDGENIEGCNDVIVKGLDNAVAQAKADNIEAARKALGAALHTLQDFYSHSNWVELGNSSIHPVIGRPGSIANIAPINVATCTEEWVWVCNTDNLITNMLTSGYFDGQNRAWTTGKCRHGGFFDSTLNPFPLGGFGGINKDTSECGLIAGLRHSPHSDDHPAATALAQAATYRAFNDVKDRLTESEFKNLLGIGATLAFAIDTTGSMGGVISSVRNTTISIVDNRLGTDQEPSKYVLTPFNDPSVGPTTVTSDANMFKSSLRSLYASGGGDCPELSMRGTFNAISASDNGGDLFIFTDASAKDASLAGSVRSLAAEKETKLFFSLFGSCSPYDPVYFDLANNSGGQVFILNSSEAGSIAELADLVSRSDSVDILSVGNVLSSDPKTYVFPVDTMTTHLTVSVSMTGSGNAVLIRPDGSEVLAGGTGVRVITTSGARIYSIETPLVGEWKITAVGSGEFSILVNGQSSLSLDSFRFVEVGGRPGHEGLYPISGLPEAGKSTDVLANLSDEAQDVVFEFRQRDGVVLNSFSLTNNDSYDATAYTGDVVLPASSFFVYVVGRDSNGASFQRLLSRAFIPQDISVIAPVPVNLPVNQVTSYLFQVENTGQTDSFRFTAIDDKSFVTNVTPSLASLATGGSVIVKVDVRPPAGTAIGTVDTLTFTAESTTRTDVKNFAVLNSQVITPPQAGDVNRDGEVNCDDLGLIKASFGKRVGQSAFNPNVDLDSNGIIDARDLAMVARQVPAGTVCN